MKLRDIIKMNSLNDGSRSLFESVAIPEVAKALQDWKINYQGRCVLIGGTATGYHAKPRATMDVDILFISSTDIPAVVSGFKRIRNGAFQHNQTHVEIEVISPQSINLPIELVQKVFETSLESDGIRVASPSGLVALKLQRMSRYDEGDIWGLIETGKVDLTDWPITDSQLLIFKNIEQKVKASI